MNQPLSKSAAPAPLGAVLWLTFAASLGTGVFWNGIPFIAKESYGFTQSRILVLYVVVGLSYVIGAFLAGTLLRRVERWLAPRSVLVIILFLEAAICFLPRLFEGIWVLWFVTCGSNLLSAWIWPLVESYLTAARHGTSMRSAIGWFNLVWTVAVAIALMSMGFFLETDPTKQTDPTLVILMLSGLYLLAAIPLLWLPARPQEHEGDLVEGSVPSSYPDLLQAARVLLPLSYILCAALTPLLPFVMDRLSVSLAWGPLAAATWMVARTLVMGVMWRIGFWHNRWGTLLLGFFALAGGFALVVAGPYLSVVLLGLTIFGAGMGLIYYAALYYAMAVGRAAVDAGGTHEGLIGVGYMLGPLVGLAGIWAGEHATAWRVSLSAESWMIALGWLFIGLGALGAIAPYRRSKTKKAQ